MNEIFYYSNYCNHSKSILSKLSKMSIKQNIHFICIDNRITEGDKTFVILDKGAKMLFPQNINRVPAVLLVGQTISVLYGNDILQHFNNNNNSTSGINKAHEHLMEPNAFSFQSCGSSISSDSYSFWDQSSDSLGAKGDGGIRQMHHYSGLNDDSHFSIQTPEDDVNYTTKGRSSDMTLENLQEQRENDMNSIKNSIKPY